MAHKHHLKPRHLGGTNDPSNLLEVTVEEHALIHEARWYAYRQWEDWLAWKGLDGCIDKEEIIRLVVSFTNKGNKYWVGRKHKEETQQKIRLSKLGKIPWNKGKKGSQVAWNKGLTKDDPRVENYSSKIRGRPSGRKGEKVGPYSAERRRNISIGKKLANARKAYRSNPNNTL